MPWIYSQRTGDLRHNVEFVAKSYAGKGFMAQNNPAFQSANDYGPLPQGIYTIGHPFHHPHAGPYAMRLTPLHGA